MSILFLIGLMLGLAAGLLIASVVELVRTHRRMQRIKEILKKTIQ